MAGILIAFALPHVWKSGLDLREESAIASVRQIAAAEARYAAGAGNGRFGTLAELERAGLIDAALGSGAKDGYAFTVELSPSGFAVRANPLSFPQTGHRGFYNDASGIVRHIQDGRLKPDAQSPEVDRRGWPFK